MGVGGQSVWEISSRQRVLLEHLLKRGFTQVVFPQYTNAIGIRRDDFAVLLVPDKGIGFQVLGQAHYLLHGKPSVRIRRDDREWFLCKNVQVEATPEILTELKRFADELAHILRMDI